MPFLESLLSWGHLAVLLLLNQYESRYYTMLGICAQRSGITELARYMYDMALTFDDREVIAKGYLGECKLIEGDVDGGLADLREAVEWGRDDSEHEEHVQRYAEVLEQYAA